MAFRNVDFGEGACNITQYPSSKLKDPVVIDMMTGEVFERTEDDVAWPIKEYPLIFCERDTFEFKD